jgi:hypothetical protein
MSPAKFAQRPNAPRDFCALYRMDVLRQHKLSFIQKRFSAGESMYLDLVDLGYTAAMIPVPEMMSYMDHIAHGTPRSKPKTRAETFSNAAKTERAVEELFRPGTRARIDGGFKSGPVITFRLESSVPL